MANPHHTQRYASLLSPRGCTVGNTSSGGGVRAEVPGALHMGRPPNPQHASRYASHRSGRRTGQRGAPRHQCHGVRRTRRVAPASAGVPGGIGMMGESPQPPRASLELLVVGSRSLGSVPGQHATPPRLPPSLDEGGTPARGPVPRPASAPLRSSLPPSMLATILRGGLSRVKAKPCGGRANTARASLDTRPPRSIARGDRRERRKNCRGPAASRPRASVARVLPPFNKEEAQENLVVPSQSHTLS